MTVPLVFSFSCSSALRSHNVTQTYVEMIADKVNPNIHYTADSEDSDRLDGVSLETGLFVFTLFEFDECRNIISAGKTVLIIIIIISCCSALRCRWMD